MVEHVKVQHGINLLVNVQMDTLEKLVLISAYSNLFPAYLRKIIEFKTFLSKIDLFQ